MKVFWMKPYGFFCLTAILGSLALGGCAGLGAVYGIFIDPWVPAPTIKAEHDMSRKKVLIWVDRTADSGQQPQLVRELTEKIAKELKEHKAILDSIDYNTIAQYRYTHLDYADKPRGKIGEALGAEEVIHLTIEQVEIEHEAGKGYYRTALNGTIRVIEAGTDARLWPADLSNRSFFVEGQLQEGQGGEFELKLVEEMCETAAQQIAPWFYNHKGPK